MSENELTALPSEFGELQNLRSLDLGIDIVTAGTKGNFLTGLPPEISQLHNLQELSLSGNNFVVFPL